MPTVYYTCKRDTNRFFALSKHFDAMCNGEYHLQDTNKQKFYTFKQDITWHNFYRQIDLHLTSEPIEHPEEEYHTFSIPKKSGGYREICAPNDNLKAIQSELLIQLQRLCPYPHEAAHAYVEHRSTKTAMEKHLNNKSHWYLKLDLHGFFPSCTTLFTMERLQNIYPFYKLSLEAKNIIIKYCFKDGALPQGAPTSPFLSNMVMIGIDYAITEYCNQNNLVYTRYADDMIISGYNKFDWHAVEEFVVSILPRELELNKEKTRVGSASGRNWNLGLMVTNNKITVGNQRKRRLKQSLYNYQKTKDTWLLNDLHILLGELQYVIQIEPDIYEKMYVPKFGDVRKEIIEQIKLLNRS